MREGREEGGGRREGREGGRERGREEGVERREREERGEGEREGGEREGGGSGEKRDGRERERMKVKEMIAILFRVRGASKEGRTRSCDTNNYMQCALMTRATIMDKSYQKCSRTKSHDLAGQNCCSLSSC